jgi:iron(III) transport system substrate-binding protein
MSGIKIWRYLFLLIGLGLGALTPSPSAAQGNPFNQLVETSRTEMAKKGGKLSVAMEWEQSEGTPVVEAFKRDFPHIKEITYNRESRAEHFQRILMELQQAKPLKYDIMHVSSESWPEYRKAGQFVKPPFDYSKLVKALPSGWDPIDSRSVDPNGYFLATSGLARGIAYNKDQVAPDKAPKSWEDCLNPMWRGKFLYDPRPKLTALQHDPRTREAHLKWLRGIVENKVILGRGQSENLQKIASGEFPLFCGVNYHSALRIIDQGAPINFVFPDPLPLEFGGQIHIGKWSQTPATTQLFILWLASEAQELVEKHGYRGFPWSPKSRKYAMAKGKYVAICDAECVLMSQKYDDEHANILKLPGVR